MLCMLISLLSSVFQTLPSTTKQAVSDKKHFLLFFLLGTVEDPRRKTALLPLPVCCGTTDGGAVRQLSALGCSQNLLCSQRIRPNNACCRHSSMRIRQPHWACIDYPLFCTAAASLMPQGNVRNVVRVL